MDQITRQFRDALRLLFILAKAGESAPAALAVPHAVAVVTSEKKFQKMDFWMRNPDHFAYALIEAHLGEGDADHLASAKAIVDSEEPEIRRDAMLKYLYGAYEPLDTALAPLFSYGLARMKRNPETKQRMYFLLPKGLETTERLVAELPEAQWYSDRAALIGTFCKGKSGDQLAKWQYRHPSYAGARTEKPSRPLRKKCGNESWNWRQPVSESKNKEHQKAMPPLKVAVAEKAKVSLAAVDSIFAQAQVVEETGTRRAEHLTIHRLAFSGEKRAAETDNGPFAFEWRDLDSGLWLVLSDNENQIGKSSILGVMMWALRGTQRSVPAPVRAWIEHVELDFSIGLDQYRVAFDDKENTPKGVLVRTSPGPARELSAFDGEDEFRRSMGDFMMRRFALQSIPVVNRKSEEASQIRHDWNSYAGSMFIESSHPAILGDVAVAGLWWRMLQLFIGTPYSGAQIALGSALVLEKLRSEQNGANAMPASSHREEIQRLSSRIADLETEWTALSATAPRPEDAPELLRTYTRAALEVSKIEQSVADLVYQRSAMTVEVNEARSMLRRLKDGSAAKKFFAGLSPVCCPRCAIPFAIDRLELEQDGGNCAICDRDTLADDHEALAAAIAETTERLNDSKAADAELAEREAELREALSTAKTGLEQLESDIGRLDHDVDDVRKQQELRLELERARGAHDQLRALELEQAAPTADKAAAERNRILKIAENIADERSKLAGAELLGELETKLVEVASRVGFRGLERVSIRGNGIKLTVSGTPGNFSDQTPGQRLRLRISLVIAMMKLARRTGQGHHPGLLFIDSPGAEEMSEADLNAMMNEIRSVCDEMSNLQIFVSSARGATFKSTVPEGRQRWPKVVGSMF